MLESIIVVCARNIFLEGYVVLVQGRVNGTSWGIFLPTLCKIVTYSKWVGGAGQATMLGDEGFRLSKGREGRTKILHFLAECQAWKMHYLRKFPTHVRLIFSRTYKDAHIPRPISGNYPLTLPQRKKLIRKISHNQYLNPSIYLSKRTRYRTRIHWPGTSTFKCSSRDITRHRQMLSNSAWPTKSIAKSIERPTKSSIAWEAIYGLCR